MQLVIKISTCLAPLTTVLLRFLKETTGNYIMYISNDCEEARLMELIMASILALSARMMAGAILSRSFESK